MSDTNLRSTERQALTGNQDDQALGWIPCSCLIVGGHLGAGWLESASRILGLEKTRKVALAAGLKVMGG